MWIKKKEIEQLSEFVKGYSSGEELDIRENKEGSFNILKNDIYALVNTKKCTDEAQKAQLQAQIDANNAAVKADADKMAGLEAE